MLLDALGCLLGCSCLLLGMLLRCSCLPLGMLLSASWDAPVMLLSASWDAPVCLLGCSCLPPTLFRGFRFFAVQGFPWFPCSGVSFFPLFRGCDRIPVSGGAGRVPPSCLLSARTLGRACGLLLRAAFGSASWLFRGRLLARRFLVGAVQLDVPPGRLLRCSVASSYWFSSRRSVAVSGIARRGCSCRAPSCSVHLVQLRLLLCAGSWFRGFAGFLWVPFFCCSVRARQLFRGSGFSLFRGFPASCVAPTLFLWHRGALGGFAACECLPCVVFCFGCGFPSLGAPFLWSSGSLRCQYQNRTARRPPWSLLVWPLVFGLGQASGVAVCGGSALIAAGLF